VVVGISMPLGMYDDSHLHASFHNVNTPYFNGR
jgi:hypothetical protein